MSGFNTIKKSRKRSHEIEEKLNVLNRELEKTKDIQEQPTVNTGDLYTKVQQSEPSDFQGPLDVPNTAGVGDDDFTQSSAGTGEDGHASSYSDTSQLSNSSVNSPVFESPNGIEGAAASFGVVEYTGTGAGTNYGVILGGNIVELVLGGFIAGGTRAAQHYIDIYEAYLATNEASPGFYSEVEIAQKRIAASRASSVESIRNSAAARGLEFNIPWQGYRTPQFGESMDGRTTYVHPTRGTLVLSGFKLLGLPATYHIGGDRGGTTAGPSKGTGDPDQYPPIPWFERLGKEAFEYLKDLAKSPLPLLEPMLDLLAGITGTSAEKDNVDDYMRNFIPDLFAGKEPTGSTPDNPRDNSKVYDDETISDYEKIFKDYQKEINGEKGPLDNSWQTNYDLKQRDNSSIGNTTGTLDSSAGDGFIDNGDGTETLRKAFDFDRYDDMAGSNLATTLGAMTYGIISGIPGLLIKSGGKTPTMYTGITFDKTTGKVIKGGVKESYQYSKHLIKENAYMALLDRTYKPTERDYVKYAMDTPAGRKQFDKDVKMVHEFIKKNPDKYEYVMKRYPKDDPRLSMLNYRMDRMTEASDKYLETQFPTNQTLFTKVKERTRKNMNLTDPKNFKPVKDPIKYVDVKKTKKLKETVTRHFNKPVKSKSMFGLNMGKVRKTNQKMIEKREQEQRVKEEERAYIQEKMSRQKSNWKDDLTEV